MNKEDLRSTYKQKRKTLNQSTIENLSLQIANQALKLPIWNASFFHIFLTIKHLKEIETEPLISILFGKDKNDLKLINDLLHWMNSNQADYTNTFCHLMNVNSNNDSKYKDINFINWFKQWESRVLVNNVSTEKSINLMKKNNPTVVPRNHKVEEALEAANNNDLSLTKKLLSILDKPYDNQKDIELLEQKEIILTTEKDYMRLFEVESLRDKLFYIPIEITLDKPKEFNKLIQNFVN